MANHEHLPFSVALDDTDEPADVIDALLLEPFVAGAQPAARVVRLERVKPDATLLPEGVEPDRVAVGDGRRAVLATGDGWTLKATRWNDGCATVMVVAATEALAGEVIAQAVAGACEARAPDDPRVPLAFWHRRCDGRPRRTSREILPPQWASIRRNYAASAASALERLMSHRPGDAGGRLILLHGPPGTGKTTALRSLAAAWRDWCRTEVVVDPELLAGDSAYLTSVLLGRDEDDDDPDGGRWRLLILEDCDELLRSDARRVAGQALGRLLNVTDGLIGQGLELLVVLTTNEPIAALHPAVVRPGRCLAEIHIGRLSRAEATVWLGSGRDIPGDGATLAELYALRDASAPVRAAELRAVRGTYL